MAEFDIANAREFEQFLKKEINKRMKLVVEDSEQFLIKQSDKLRDSFEKSQEFRDLQTRLVGEFGFTPEEVRDLPKILTLLVPNNSNNVTSIKLTRTNNEFAAILEWVDFDKLKQHPLAQHELTRLNPRTGQFEVTEIISWVDWLENGAVVRGYDFQPVQENFSFSKFSRSGKGIMRPVGGGLWQFQPTKVFDNIGQSFSQSDFRRGFGAVIRRRRR